MNGFAQTLWGNLLRDTPLIYPQVFLMVAATLMLWPGDLLVPKAKKHLWAYITLGVMGVALLLTMFPGEVGRTGFSGMFRLDGVTIGFQVLCLGAGLLTVLLSQPQLEAMKEQRVEYYALLLYSLVGMLFLCGATDLVSVFFAVELMAICIYILVGYFRHQERSVEAGLKYFLLGAFSSGVMLFGMSLLFAAGGGATTNLVDLNTHLSLAVPNHALLVGAGVVLVMAGFAFKVAAVPFHQWSPDAYEGAPTPITAFMSTAPKAAALAAFLRVFGTGFQGLHGEWSMPLGWIAAASMILGNVAALRQQSLKRMLAYSSIGHVGIMLLAILAPDTLGGAQALWLYMAIYVLMQMGAFATLIVIQGKGVGERLEDFKGLGKREPVLAFAMMVFMLSLAGIPPLVGFFSKFYLFRLAVAQGYIGLTVVAVLASVVGAAYYLKVVQWMYFHDPLPDAPRLESSNLGMVIGLCAVLVLAGTLMGHELMVFVERVGWV